MNGRGKTNITAALLFFCAVTLSARQQLPDSIFFTVVSSAPLYHLAQDISDSKDLNYANYFSTPEEEGGVVSVFYNNLIDSEDNEQFGYALLYGLDYASATRSSAAIIAVGIYFTNGKGKIYFMPRKAYEDFRAKKIGTAQLFDQLSVKDVVLENGASSSIN
ncbi:MAG: hypothetical protein JW904_00355 [Spirochaetales bacterium]|nr:hypothetical protein [Spirochaetales bacterium]